MAVRQMSGRAYDATSELGSERLELERLRDWPLPPASAPQCGAAHTVGYWKLLESGQHEKNRPCLVRAVNQQVNLIRSWPPGAPCIVLRLRKPNCAGSSFASTCEMITTLLMAFHGSFCPIIIAQKLPKQLQPASKPRTAPGCNGPARRMLGAAGPAAGSGVD